MNPINSEEIIKRWRESGLLDVDEYFRLKKLKERKEKIKKIQDKLNDK